MPTFRCSSNTLIKATKTKTKIKLLIQQSEPIRRTEDAHRSGTN